MEYCLQPWVSSSFLQNNNHQAVKKMEWIKMMKNTDKKPLGISFMCGCLAWFLCLMAYQPLYVI